jgi:hypothetical protein
LESLVGLFTLFLALLVSAGDLIRVDQGVGPVGRQTSRADLDKLGLGDRGLEDGSAVLPGSELLFPATEVFDDQPQRHMTVVWTDEARSNIRAIVIAQPKSQWRTEQGVGVGTPLAELQALNGRPFSFNGFGPDTGGQITDWRGGVLQVWSGKLTLFLAADDEVPRFPRVLSSDSTEAEALHLRVGQLQLRFVP